MQTIPPILMTYIAGLKAHDVTMIAGTVSDDIRFITPSATIGKDASFPSYARYTRPSQIGHYDHDEPVLMADEIAVKWRQSGTLSLPGVPPVNATGTRVTIPVQFFFYRMHDGLIVENCPEPIVGYAPPGKRILASQPMRVNSILSNLVAIRTEKDMISLNPCSICHYHGRVAFP